MTTKVKLAPKCGYRVEAGHPWVYDNEIHSVDGPLEPGVIAEVFNHKDRFIGRGIANPKSHICVRLFTRDFNEAVNADLIRRRLTRAWEYRRQIGYTENCRIVFSESDFLSGLIVDKFGDIVVLQILSYAIESFKDVIVATLTELIHPRGIFERSDAAVREREGLAENKGFLSASFETTFLIHEPDGVKFFVDVQNGQKTGFFLDQKENRLVLKSFVKDAEVLDAFCYTGSFSLYAAKYGAKSVVGLDQSAEAVQLCQKNAEANGVSDVCDFQEVNAFDALNDWSRAGRCFDVIILDPPAFTKNRAGLDGAIRGYKDINLRALKMIKPGGFLISSSCSHFMNPMLFKDVIFDAAKDARRSVRQVLYQTQAKDHPILWGVDEALYLKFFVLNVM